MKFFARRRLRSILITAVLAGILYVLFQSWTQSLRNTAYLSGWILFGVMVFLTSYNLRKKLTFLPIGRSALWLQIHIYLGFLSIFIFLCHVSWRVPNGKFEGLMAVLYALVAGSGVVGLFLTRTIPPRLAVRGEEVIFERIPIFRRQLKQKAEALVEKACLEAEATTIADFYTRRLVGFFAAPRNYFYHLIESGRPRHALMNELGAMDRYLNDKERAVITELTEVIVVKDDLDYHSALQGTLKFWLFLHVSLTYALMIFVMVHLVLVHAFYGGWR